MKFLALPMFLLLTVLLATSTVTAADDPPRVYRDVVRPNWSESGDTFWYRNDLKDGAVEFIFVDTEAGLRRPAFDHACVAAALSQATGEEIEAARLPIESLARFEKDSVILLGTDKSWRLDLATCEISIAEGSAGIEGLPFDRVIRPSRYLGGSTHVTFLNQLDQTVDIFWIDGGGGRIKYHSLAPKQRARQHTYEGHVWLVTGEDGGILAVFQAPQQEDLTIIDDREATPAAEDTAAPDSDAAAVSSPDAARAVFVRDHNLWLRDLKTGTESQLSFDGAAGDSYVRDTQRDRLVEMDYEKAASADSLPEVFWSPDSRHLLALRTRTVRERTVYMVESAPHDQLQPKLRSYPYLKPGDDIPVGIPHVFDTEESLQIPLDETLFAHPWDITDFHWSSDGSECYFLYNQRGHQVMRVIGIEADTGRVRAVVDETCETFFDYQGKTFLSHLDGSDQLIWMSERDGWNHLYLWNRGKGREKRRVTEGNWVVRGVERVDEESGRIWFTASGINPGEDPYHIHHCRADLEGGDVRILTDGDGTHSIQWSPDRRFFVDKWSRVDLPPVHVLRDADGRLVCELEAADASEILATGHRYPERFSAPGRDGKTAIHGIIHTPADFDPGKAYPVIESIYAGPHGQHVPKAFRAHYRLQSLADLGFVIVQIDGMGTNWRSKAFHDVCWQNIVDSGFPDRIAWMEEAARQRPWMNISRVGIYGGSAGGQNTVAALLTHPEFYHVGVADCGCHDNRMDKIWWNEQWMGYPVGPHYEAQSNVTLAPGLEGELLLIVGELDHNVDPASTMQVVDALIKADRDFDMLVIPGAGHGAAGTDYGRRRATEFLVEHLLD